MLSLLLFLYPSVKRNSTSLPQNDTLMALLAPSILSADFGHLERDLELINRSQADWFHIDVMDGRFVPNISFGFPAMDVVQKVAQKPIDVHLMIEDPDAYIPTFAQKGAHIISIHYETCRHLHRSVQLIKDQGCKASVVLNPHSPVHLLSDIIDELDMVLLMSVNPGFGGQRFIPRTLDKIKTLRAMKPQDLLIQVDGGVTLDNCAELVALGADALVAGSAVYGAEDPTERIAAFKRKMG